MLPSLDAPSMLPLDAPLPRCSPRCSGKQLIAHGGDISQVSGREVLANIAGGAFAGALAVATGGSSLVESGVVGDIIAGGTSNLIGGIVTRTAQGASADDVLSLGDISQDAVSGFVGGGAGHAAASVIHVPAEPFHNARRGVGAIRSDNAKFAKYNQAVTNQIARAAVTGSGATHTTNGVPSIISRFWDWFSLLNPAPPPPPPAPKLPVGCVTTYGPNGPDTSCQ